MVTPKQVEEISSFFPLKVLRATGDNPQCEVALVRIAKSLHDLFRFFEPAFFKGKLFVSKHFDDDFVFEKGNGVLLLDKNPLLERFDGNLFIQVLNDGKAYLWEDQDEGSIYNRDDVLTYFYEENREYFLVADQKIDFTQYPYGSMFAPQFYFLDEAFREFEVEKVSVSSCPIFAKVWHRPPNPNKDPFDNRVLFQGGGSGSGIPEKHMQDSFENFLK